MKTPRLKLASTQTAVTYSFHATGGDFGWANCTVNDSTGDLHISSDWGNWSHRWDPRPSCLGAPSLTAFIGSRNNVDYLARKLQAPSDLTLREVILPALIEECRVRTAGAGLAYEESP